MKVIVCGGRDFSDQRFLFEWLDKFHSETPITLLIEGGARGADRQALAWAITRNVKWIEDGADWDSFGKPAGHLRNGKMLNRNPEVVIAFPGHAGTADIIAQAIEAKVKVILAGDHKL